MTTICILGAGELGAATAHALARGERVARVLLVDAAAGVAAGKALDLQQAGAIEGCHVRLHGTDDPTRAAGCAAIVVADRHPAKEWAGEDGLGLLTRLAPYVGDTPLVFAGAEQTGLLVSAGREAGYGRERLIGSAPEAFASAIRAMVAMEAGGSPADVNLTALGVPGRFVVPWSEASIGGHALERVLTQVQIARLEGRAARLWPPGPFALGEAAARAVEGIVCSARRTFNVLTVLGGEFGVRNRAGTLPALLSTAGISHTRVPALNTRERVQVETALGV
jgi:malate dehydrogenase